MVGGKIRSSPTSYIGIAVYASEHPCEHWVIVLSSNRLFEGPVLCGTVFEDVNGLHLAWTTCKDSPATWSLYMSFRGIVHIAKAERSMTHIQGFISAGHHLRMIRTNNKVLCFSTQTYAVDSLLRLCKEEYIKSPAPARENDFTTFVTHRAKRFADKPKPNRDSYPIVPFEGGIVFGHTKF